MLWRLFIAGVAVVAAQDDVEEDLAPPPPPPPKPKRQAEKPRAAAKVSESTGPEETWHDKMRRLAVEKSAGIQYVQGNWSYGDHKQNVDAHTVADCASVCEADKKCMHWQFHLEKNRCDLKTHGGSFAGGAPEWIMGHSRHWKDRKEEL